MPDLSTIIIAAAGLLVLLLFFKIFSKPIKWILKLLLNALLGFVILIVVNYLGAFVGLKITVGWVSALVAGVLGAPGVILLLLIENLLL